MVISTEADLSWGTEIILRLYRELLRSGALPTTVDSLGKTPLELAQEGLSAKSHEHPTMAFQSVVACLSDFSYTS